MYVTSANCATEVEHFLGSGRDTPRIERKSRMARLAIIPYAKVDNVCECFRRDDTLYYVTEDAAKRPYRLLVPKRPVVRASASKHRLTCKRSRRTAARLVWMLEPRAMRRLRFRLSQLPTARRGRWSSSLASL